MKRSYHTLANRGKVSERQLAAYLTKNGQQLLPMVELIERSHLAIEELIDAVGRVTLQTVLEMSAAQIAGEPQQGKLRAGEMLWHRLSPGTLYPIMHGLEKKGLLRSKEQRVGGKIRRVYSATPSGRKALDSAKERVRELFGELFED